jgi:threonyl-tRNA synthetase
MTEITPHNLNNHDLCLHLLAAAVSELFPKVQIVKGQFEGFNFSYDFVFPGEVGPKDLETIEERMWDLSRQSLDIIYSEMMRENAAEFFRFRRQKLKASYALEEPFNIIKILKIGNYCDICYADGMENTVDFRHFKLNSLKTFHSEDPIVGDICLTRITGLASSDKKKFKKAVKGQELLKKHHHLKQGKQQKLFFAGEQGFDTLFWTSKGERVKLRINSWLEKKILSAGFEKVSTPYEKIQKKEGLGLFKAIESSHKEFWKCRPSIQATEGFKILESFRGRGEEKDCYPHLDHSSLFASSISNKEGVLRAFRDFLGLVNAFEQDFSLKLKPILLRKEGQKNDNPIIKELSEVFKSEGLDYKIDENEAHCEGFYLEFRLEDRMAREHVLGFCKLNFDFFEKGHAHLSYSLFASAEALTALLLEEFAGELPLWLLKEG